MADKVKSCLIICGSPDSDIGFLLPRISEFDCIVCADSGYRKAEEYGILPDLIVGDFDSYSGVLPDNIERITLNTHKDDTDSLHCASVLFKRGFSRFTLVGATGGRLDHTFANLSVLEYICDKGAYGEILSKSEYIRFLSSGEYELCGYNGLTFSVFPFGCNAIQISYEGEVEYPAENLIINSSAATGISNIFRSDYVKLVLYSGKAILMINK